MSRFMKAPTAAVLGALTLALSMSASYGQDANAVAQRLKETLATQGADLSWSAVSGSGGQVILDGVTYSAGSVPPFKLGKLTLDGVTEANGGFNATTMTLDGLTFGDAGFSGQISPVIMSGVTIPAPGETDLLKSSLWYDSGKIDRLEFKLGDKQVALLENTHFELTPPSSGPMTFSGTAEKISADLSQIPDPKAQAVVQALGYQNITGNLQMNGSWNPTDGRMEVSRYDINVDNAGKLGLTFDIGGYTMEFLKAMQELQKQMAANPGADPNAQNIAMLGLMQQLVFNGASVRFEDASLTNKALDFVAKQQGADPAQMKEQTKTIIPFLLASSPIKDEALKKQIADAVAAYMDNPKSLTIRAKPATPQPFSSIAAQGQADPAALTTTLGVSVSAND